MKLLHTADWHLGKKLDHISRLPEQNEVMAELCEIAKNQQVDAVLVAGDIFDNANPPIEAIELFHKTLKTLARNGECAVIVIAGNHDSPDRIAAPASWASDLGILLAAYPDTEVRPFVLESGLEVLKTDEGFVELRLAKCDTPLRLLLTPYANELRLRQYLGEENSEETLRQLLEARWKRLADTYCDKKGVNILVAHLFVMKKGEPAPEEDEGERSVLMIGGAQQIYTENFPSQLQYVALGHLHRNQRISHDYPVIYSSSPLAYSMKEAEQTKYAVIVQAEANEPVQYERVALTAGRKLYRKTFEDVSEAETWLQANPNTIVEITLKVKEYLGQNERRTLYGAHEYIHSIVPQSEKTAESMQTFTDIDPNDDIESLFVKYFTSKKKELPNDEILTLFREVLAQEEKED
ncbi:MAG: exonuclease SbcCD subunit D [Bacteroidia bacterium]